MKIQFVLSSCNFKSVDTKEPFKRSIGILKYCNLDISHSITVHNITNSTPFLVKAVLWAAHPLFIAYRSLPSLGKVTLVV